MAAAMSSSSGLVILSRPSCTSFAETHLGKWLAGLPIRRIRPFRSWTCQSPQTETVELGKSKHLEFPIFAPPSRELSSVFSCRAIGPNVNEDADDMFDDLLNKHGKVVFRRNDQQSPTAEVDDDAESLSFAVAMAKIASEVKAADIRVLFVKPLVYWTRFFIVVTAFSHPQIDAIKTKLGDLAEKKFGRTASGDSKPNSWTLLDYVVLRRVEVRRDGIRLAPIQPDSEDRPALGPVQQPGSRKAVLPIQLQDFQPRGNKSTIYGNLIPVLLPEGGFGLLAWNVECLVDKIGKCRNTVVG